jgi:hypothetical protein
VKYLVATVVLLLAGCGHMGEVNRAFRSYEQGLAVSVVVVSEEVTIGTATPAAITLSNGGPGSIAGCLGPRSQFVWLTQPVAMRDGRPPVMTYGDVVDHPRCQRLFTLDPGEALTWPEDLQVPDIGPGAAELTVSVDILYPRRCHQLYGCYGLWLKAPAVILQLKSAAS